MEGLGVAVFYVIIILLFWGALFAFSLTYLIVNRKRKGLLIIKIPAGIIVVISIYLIAAILFGWLII